MVMLAAVQRLRGDQAAPVRHHIADGKLIGPERQLPGHLLRPCLQFPARKPGANRATGPETTRPEVILGSGAATGF